MVAISGLEQQTETQNYEEGTCGLSERRGYPKKTEIENNKRNKKQSDV